MTFLPIVGRELRVAARLRFTFWSRISAAAFALLIFGLLQSLSMASRGAIGGHVQFTILKWMGFIFALAAGVFLTSDSVSEEKREGTLGLLFLTDLRGYDIVFGKFFSQSLRAFYALLAAFPIMALTLFAGGVTGAEFARSLIVICNTLLLSLSAGLLVSTISRDATKAMSATLLVLLLLVAGLPLADLALAGWDGAKFRPILTAGSPYDLFDKTGFVRAGEFWGELGIQSGIAFAFFALASVAASRTWKEKTSASDASRMRFSRSWRYGGARFRAALKRKFLEQQPILWLTSRDRWLPRLTFLVAISVLLIQGTISCVRIIEVFQNGPAVAVSPIMWIGSVLQGFLGLGLTLWVTTQASRIFVEYVRNGAFELMLITPVTAREIVHAQWTALWKTFLLPAVCVVLLQTAGGVVSVLQMNATIARVSAPTPTATNSPAGTNTLITNRTASSVTVTTSSGTVVYSSMNNNFAVYQIFAVAISVVTSLAGLVAIAWFGMWMGLTNRKVPVAVLKTICFVSLIPWIAISFIQGLVMFSAAFSGALLTPGGNPYTMIILSTLVAGALHVGKDVFFVVWSRKRLLNRFREAVSRDWRHKFRPPATIPPLPPIGAEPPVIAAAT